MSKTSQRKKLVYLMQSNRSKMLAQENLMYITNSTCLLYRLNFTRKSLYKLTVVL